MPEIQVEVLNPVGDYVTVLNELITLPVLMLKIPGYILLVLGLGLLLISLGVSPLEFLLFLFMLWIASVLTIPFLVKRFSKYELLQNFIVFSKKIQEEMMTVVVTPNTIKTEIEYHRNKIKNNRVEIDFEDKNMIVEAIFHFSGDFKKYLIHHGVDVDEQIIYAEFSKQPKIGEMKIIYV